VTYAVRKSVARVRARLSRGQTVVARGERRGSGMPTLRATRPVRPGRYRLTIVEHWRDGSRTVTRTSVVVD
jgi:hypothetical protein